MRVSTTKDKKLPKATIQNFPIVGIGASAGGLDAFKQLLKEIPEDSGMAYVLVQHLDPTHMSLLPEILQKVTRIPVHEITDDIKLAPDHIYIIPSNKILTSIDGALKLSPRNKNIQNLSIDIFFKSLAEVHTTFAVGIILSGTGSDGTLGLKAIKAYGGITIAQDPSHSAYPAMPNNAIEAGVVDFVLTPGNIPQHILQIKSGAEALTYNAAKDGHTNEDDDIAYKQILEVIHQSSGVDFTHYKKPTTRRRIARRMSLKQSLSPADYLTLLRQDKAEQVSLFQDMLIQVTSFFRDTKAFQVLCDVIIPRILKNKSGDEPIRVWVAGCSTGEEAYSIAICLHECCSETFPNVKIQLFASDISEHAIKKARTGLYSKSDVQILGMERLKNYFIKTNEGYQVCKAIRDMCVFATHNILKDPPFAKLDLISSRNVLIYMDSCLQKKAIAAFHYALKENGILLLGKSETIGTLTDLFTPVNKLEKIYKRNPVAGRFLQMPGSKREKGIANQNPKPASPAATLTDFRKSAEAVLLSSFTPAGVIVNEQLDVVHIHGRINQFFEQSPGRPTFNLFKMAREGLSFELRNALHKAKTIGGTVIKEGIPLKVNENQVFVNIQVIPLPHTLDPHYLILFQIPTNPVPDKAAKSSGSAARDKLVRELELQNIMAESELAQTREDMRSIAESMEASNEEMQSANEELLSSSEEMQSLNEELETSKEELQSTNEELTIVNHELLDKQEQLKAASSYSNAIITTLREPLIVLDKAQRVKTANASFYKIFNVEEKEIEGKLFYEIQNHQFDDVRLRSLLEKILPLKNRIEDFEIILNFSPDIQRTILLNAQQIINDHTAEQLILLVLEDITEKVKSVKTLKESEARSRAFVDSNIVAVCFTHMDDTIVFDANNAYLNMLGYTRDELQTGKINRHDYTPQEFLVQDHKALEIAMKDFISPPYEKDIVRRDGVKISVLKGRALINNSEIMSVFIDITERKISEQKIKFFNLELETKVKERTNDLEQVNSQLQQFAYVASHDLQEPLRKIITFSNILKQNHTDNLSDIAISYLNRIENASGRMRNLIHDLLHYSQIINSEKQFTSTDLNVILKDVLCDFELLIEDKKATIISDVLPVINAIPMQMNQLICNLISNALKFSKTDQVPVIKITSQILPHSELILYEDLDPKVPYYKIIFSDNGIGFEEKYEEQIFIIFQRLHQKENYKGTGIGLALCKKIVMNHSGAIFAKSKDNRGTDIHVFLPASPIEDKSFSMPDPLPIIMAQ